MEKDLYSVFIKFQKAMLKKDKAIWFVIVKWIVIGSCFCFFVYCTIKWAWCSDDAYHAYSMSKNLIDGNGFTPTVGKRVNVSTCPFWTLIVTLGMILFKDEYYVGMVLNLLFSWGAYVGLLYIIFLNDRPSRGVMGDSVAGMSGMGPVKIFMLIGSTVLICNSKSFISYTTSGLENALLFFLSTLFVIFFFRVYRNKRYFDDHSIFVLAFIVGLIIFTRMDNVLIFTPVCIFAGVHIKSNGLKERCRRYVERVCIALGGVLPFIVWEIFSFIYYGMLVPNTALAKLNTGFPKYQYIERGVAYYIKTLDWDITVVAIPFLFIAISVFMICAGKIKEIWTPYLLFAVGIVLYMMYIVYIGGDFMMGRHFTNVFWCSLLALSFLVRDIEHYMRKEAIACAILLSCFVIVGTMLIQMGIWINPFSIVADDVKWVYTDERKVYIPYTGLINVVLNGKSRIKECKHRGIQWYFGVDWYEERLYDPLLSRLPAEDNDDSWAVGHMEREFPEGYSETLDSGRNQIVDESLYTYYEMILEIVSGDVFSADRFKKIIFLNLGKYDYLIEKYLENDG